MEFILLALLGIGAATLLFNSDDTAAQNDDGTPPDGDNGPPPEPNPNGRRIVLESGTLNPAGGAGNDSFSGIVEGTVRAGGGDDRFNFEGGYGASIHGGSGNDSFVGGFGDNFTLIGGSGNDVFGFTADTFDGAAAHGGAGNDSFTIDLPDVPNSAGAVLSGGDGVDSFTLNFTSGIASEPGAGQIAVLKDFKPGEDVMDIDVQNHSGVEVIEDASGGFTDLRLYFTATDDAGAAVERYATVRLEGVTGTSLADLGVTLPEPTGSQGRLYEIGPGVLGVNGGSGNDTISGMADGSIDGWRFVGGGGGGDDLFDIEEGGFGATLEGGAGNDTVFGDMVGGSVYGQGGEDFLRISAGPSDPVYVYGGDANDTLDGRGSDNIVLEGGAGDDLIVTDGAAYGGAGYDFVARGGAGDDTLSHSVEVMKLVSDDYRNPARLTGGEGADAFNINLTIGERRFEPSP